jgi:hypothetical protein
VKNRNRENRNETNWQDTYTTGLFITLVPWHHPDGDSMGNRQRRLYGATQWGGNPGVQCGSFTTGCGTVFKLTP